MHDDRVTLPPDGPADSRPDLDLPGANRPETQPDPDDQLPERLGERIAREPDGIATGEPDLLPNVEVPDTQM